MKRNRRESGEVTVGTILALVSAAGVIGALVFGGSSNDRSDIDRVSDAHDVYKGAKAAAQIARTGNPTAGAVLEVAQGADAMPRVVEDSRGVIEQVTPMVDSALNEASRTGGQIVDQAGQELHNAANAAGQVAGDLQRGAQGAVDAVGGALNGLLGR